MASGSQGASQVTSAAKRSQQQDTLLISRSTSGGGARSSGQGSVPTGLHPPGDLERQALRPSDRLRVGGFGSGPRRHQWREGRVRDQARRAGRQQRIAVAPRPNHLDLAHAWRRAANGPSFSPAVDGSFNSRPSCVAFLSAASNIVGGDTNGLVDAFVSRGPGGKPRRVSLPGGQRASADTTSVAVSGDCSRTLG